MKIVAVLNRMENSKEKDKNYLNAIKMFGGVPLLINESNLDLLELCGGILITGGYNKSSLDDYLIKYALDNKLPLLGICQGMQSMAMYGSNCCLTEVENHYEKEHCVYLEESNLKRIIGKDKIIVNSYHHMQIKSASIFDVVAYSEDKVVEAIENKNHPFQIL